MASVCLIYVTCENNEAARRIGKRLVESRLAACVNIIDGMNSIYRWEGKLQDDRETVLIVKTTQDLADQVVAELKSLHGYECPCVLKIPIEGGNEDFLTWIEKQVT